MDDLCVEMVINVIKKKTLDNIRYSSLNYYLFDILTFLENKTNDLIIGWRVSNKQK